ncbi:MAG: hypothetical protein MJ176_03140 [Treponema sp.]|nr:hypothetical protein [Treponema sp.]
MSNRFYVNEVQIFGNNEMFGYTYEELEKQGAEWTKDGTFREINITDPQALMDAVTKDTADYLKEVNCDYFDYEKHKDVHKDFEELKDSDILTTDKRSLINCLYDEDGQARDNAWLHLTWYVDERRVFTPFNLYQAIKNSVEVVKGKLTLKEGCIITAKMY